MCKWPTLPHQQAEGTIGGMKSPPLKAMIIADTHILGWREGHWLDRIRREWMMEKSFQASMTIHNPQVVFMLGDLLDEGKWCSSKEFNFHVKRFKKMFKVPSGTDVYTVAGNHDIGFHYMISDYNRRRFDKAFSTSPVQMVHKDGVTFVLLNSMAMEGDGCNLCSQAINDLEDISWELKCAKGISEGKEMPAVCNGFNKFKYSQPILLQHFPMYRTSDANCTVPDAAPLDEKYIPFREKWDCLSQEASKQLFEWINPRLIISGHTHHGCYVLHNEFTPEWTVSSFSWRNKKNPSFLLAVITEKTLKLVSAIYQMNTQYFLYTSLDRNTEGFLSSSCKLRVKKVELRVIKVELRVKKVELRVKKVELRVTKSSCELRKSSCELRKSSCELQKSSCELQKSSCELRKSSCELRKSSCELRKSSCELRKSSCELQKVELRVRKVELRVTKVELRVKKVELRVTKILFTPNFQV
ncbi:MPPE1 [Mytilus edulis]|uniref:MPPE1 n=1 Tax=Mytilus edulis TaxID=6550 RepID=A0A8S3UMS8_MYTED|nr:MPPE1 [Mytilus edulis]